jgi:hypothetical protein
LKDAKGTKGGLVFWISLAGFTDTAEMAYFIGHASDYRANMQQSVTPNEYNASKNLQRVVI